MILPALATIKAIQREFISLNLESDPNPGIAASAGIISSQLEMLCAREQVGTSFVLSQLENTKESLQLFLTYTSEIPQLTKDVTRKVDRLLARINTIFDTEKDFCALELEWQNIRSEFQDAVSALVGNSHISVSEFSRHILKEMVALEEADLRRFATTEGLIEEESTGKADILTGSQIETYLKARFSDDTIRVNKFHALPGGFGKQTIMFNASGRLLKGSFVIRRDMAVHLLRNDCHMVKKEFPVLEAVSKRGFPVPDPILLETRHDIFPSADFIIMRKAEGQVGGDVFGAENKITKRLNQCLAETLAKLHTMPRLTELGDLTESIRPGQWNEPLESNVRQYISNWHSYSLSEDPYPSPAIAGLFVWLLNNVPEIQAQPVLVHGDYGFHNMIIDQENVSAVLDWEFTHIGDPAEDLGYIRNTISNPTDWERFIDIYIQNGGQSVDNERIRFFQIWGHVRNAAISAIILSKFASGMVRDIQLAELTTFLPKFIRTAYDLIESQ